MFIGGHLRQSSGVANFMSLYVMHTSRYFDGTHFINI